MPRQEFELTYHDVESITLRREYNPFILEIDFTVVKK